MKRFNFISLIMVFSLIFTCFFSVSRVNAAETAFRDYYYGDVYGYTPTKEYNLYHVEGNIYDGIGGSHTSFEGPYYSQDYCVPIDVNIIRTKHTHCLIDNNNTTIMKADKSYYVSLDNFYCKLTFKDFENDKLYVSSTSFNSMSYYFYYTDGTTSSTYSLAQSNFQFVSSREQYAIGFDCTPEKDVFKVIILLTLNHNTYNNTFYNKIQYPGFTVQWGAYSDDYPISINISRTDVSVGFLESINVFVSNIKSDLRSSLSQLTSGFTSVGTWLSNVRSGIEVKLDTVNTSLSSVKDKFSERLTDLKSGIVDKLKSVSSFFGFSVDEESMDNYNEVVENDLQHNVSQIESVEDKFVDVDVGSALDDVSALSNVTFGYYSTFTSFIANLWSKDLINYIAIVVFGGCSLGYYFFGKR